MPQENSEILDRHLIDRMHDAIAARDLEAFAQCVHPEVVWEHNLGLGSPEEGTYHGRGDVVALIQRIVLTWEQMRVEPADVIRLEDGAYWVKGELHAKHATSPAEIVTPYEQRLVIKDGLLTKGSMLTGRIS